MVLAVPFTRETFDLKQAAELAVPTPLPMNFQVLTPKSSLIEEIYICQADCGHSHKDLIYVVDHLSSTSNSTRVVRKNQVVYETRLHTTYVLISDSKSSVNPKKTGIYSRTMKKKAERMRAHLTKKNPWCGTWETYSGSGYTMQFQRSNIYLSGGFRTTATRKRGCMQSKCNIFSHLRLEGHDLRVIDHRTISSPDQFLHIFFFSM